MAGVMRRLRSDLTEMYPEGEAAAVARLIFHALKGWDATQIIIHSSDEVTPFIRRRIAEILSRLRRHEPIQYILGEARFYGLDLKVNRDTLIPRHETEELVDMIVKEYGGRSDLQVLDVGTGSGAIAIALSRNLRFPEITAIDISEGALEVARENASRLHARIRFEQKDIFGWNPPREFFDIIVSNPPYVMEREKRDMEANVLEYEPAGALFVPDADPLVYYRRIARLGLEALAQRGRIYFEINPLCAQEMQDMMERMGYTDVELREDISHRKRFLAATLLAISN